MDERIYKGVKTQLKNAWRDGVLVDEKGFEIEKSYLTKNNYEEFKNVIK